MIGYYGTKAGLITQGGLIKVRRVGVWLIMIRLLYSIRPNSIEMWFLFKKAIGQGREFQSTAHDAHWKVNL